MAKYPSLADKILTNIIDITDKKLIISCSGGPDSMVLLDIFREYLWKAAEKNLIIAHIHHGLRESAERDLKIVKDYAEKHYLMWEYLRADIRSEAQKTKTTIEECARNIRKDWLETIRKKHSADLILTAHHADDQAETLLYRITKWTSITGLIGIESLRWYYYRPLLWVSKQEIILYAQEHHIPYGYDETNEDTTIPRNLLRHEVLPRLQTINPAVEKALDRLWKSAQEIKEGFDIFFALVVAEKEFDYDWYCSLPIGFQHELLRCLYETGNGSTHGLSLALIRELDKFLSTRTGGKKELGKQWLVKKHWKVYLT